MREEVRISTRPIASAEAVAVDLRRRHIPALDGLRGLAIILVLLVHSTPHSPQPISSKRLAVAIFSSAVHSGVFGVDLFFVLSGFLITGILLDSKESPAYFRSFYVRRFLRLFPVYYGFLFVLAVTLPAAYAALHLTLPKYNGSWWWYVSYLSNWKTHSERDPALGQFWSLAVEEQFYLIWPLTVWLLPRRWLATLCVLLCGVAIVLRATANSFDIYRITPCRLDTLAIGALVALAIRNADWMDALNRNAGKIMAIGVAVFLLAVIQDWRNPWNLWSAFAAAVLFGVLVFVTATGAGRLPASMNNGLLRRYGRYSYCIYVIHEAILAQVLYARSELKALPRWVVTGLLVLLANAIIYGIAAVSWRFYESPVLRMKERWAPVRVTGAR